MHNWNLLSSDKKVACFRSYDDKIKFFFSKADDLDSCNNVPDVMNVSNFGYDSSQWRLFIGTPKCSFKAVLLHNGNKLPAAHSFDMKETYRNIRFFLVKIDYSDHAWS